MYMRKLKKLRQDIRVVDSKIVIEERKYYRLESYIICLKKYKNAMIRAENLYLKFQYGNYIISLNSYGNIIISNHNILSEDSDLKLDPNTIAPSYVKEIDTSRASNPWLLPTFETVFSYVWGPKQLSSCEGETGMEMQTK